MTLTPTAEQAAIRDAYRTGTDLTIEAGAGTGKTSTLKMLARDNEGRRGVYLAYNRNIAADARREFPTSVECRTAHGFAYQAVGKRYQARLRAPRLPARETARILGIREPVRLAPDVAPLAPQQLARIVTATVDRFCHSDAGQINAWHVPLLPGIDRAQHTELARAVVPWARQAWEDIKRIDGQLQFSHDCYLKIWQLSNPQFGADYVLLDEAQDSNPCVAGVVESQAGQRILVGDRNQAIYGWRGATDAMKKFTGKRLYLSQSFRFGPAIADEANKWLSILDTELRLTGFDKIPSTVEPVAAPKAILCRSNAGAFRRVVDSLGAGRRTALVGGGGDIQRMARAALQLQDGQPCDHPELLAFSNWYELREYVEHDPAGSDLKVFVQLVDKLGAEELIRLCDKLTDERYADTIVSTAHKAKGREWDSVRIATDFREPGEDPETGERREITREDAMLAYVAVTRAKVTLDRVGLSWVDDWLPGADYHRDPAQRIAAVAAVAPEYVQPVDPAADPVDVLRLDPSVSLLERHRQSCPNRCLFCDDNIRDRWPAPLPAGGAL